MLSVLQPLTDYRLTESLMRWSQTRVFVCTSWVDGDRYPEALWNIVTQRASLAETACCVWNSSSLWQKNWHIAWVHWTESECCKHTWTLEFHSFSLTVSFTQTSSQKHKRRAASIGKNFIYPFKMLSEGWDLALVSYIGELWGHCVNSTKTKKTLSPQGHQHRQHIHQNLNQ